MKKLGESLGTFVDRDECYLLVLWMLIPKDQRESMLPLLRTKFSKQIDSLWPILEKMQ